MAATVEKLAEQAMTLPTESRARLADLLVESLDADEPGHLDRLWVAEAKRRRDQVRSGRVEDAWRVEIERRMAELDSGSVETIPWEEVRARLYRR